VECALAGQPCAYSLQRWRARGAAAFLLLPCGAVAARCLGVLQLGATSATWFQSVPLPYALIAAGFCFGVAAYYLVWKYVVGFLNRELGIA